MPPVVMDYLDRLPDSARKAEIETISRQRQQWAGQSKKGFLRYRIPAERLAQYRAATIDLSGDAVIIGRADEVTDTEQAEIRELLRSFMPWRKGPFSVFGVEVDSEWRSQRKWNRVRPVLPDLAGRVVADVGCSNGYYMFRLAEHRPSLVVGFEPAVQPYYCFKALNSMAGVTSLHIDLLGVEHMGLFADCFDVIFLMGVIYHRPSPLDTLRELMTALKPGGTLIVESQAIPGDDPLALFPAKTYATVPGTYFVPTGACLKNWLERAGFEQVDLFDAHPMSSAEQRRTEWMLFESFDDFIDPAKPDFTVEGYPAPWRVYLRGLKK